MLLLSTVSFSFNTVLFALAFLLARAIGQFAPETMSQLMCGTLLTRSCAWGDPPDAGLGSSRSLFAVLYAAIFATVMRTHPGTRP